MGVDKRHDKRVMCSSCILGRLLSVNEDKSLSFYYSNISAKGMCAYCMSSNCLERGDVLYLIRNQTKLVIYQVCWKKYLDKETSLIGFHLINSSQECRLQNEKTKSLLRANNESANKKVREIAV